MANYRAIATGNWSAGATWAGGAVPPNGGGHNIYSNSFTVTIDTEVNVAVLTNAAITASFVGGGTSAAALGGFVANSNFNITANIGHNGTGANPPTLQISGTATFQLTGNINANSAAGNTSTSPVAHSGSGTVSIIGNVNVGITNGTPGIINSSSGTISLLGNVEGFNYDAANSASIINSSSGTCSVQGNLIVGKSQHALLNRGTGTLNYTGNATGGATSTGIPIANTSAGIVNVTGNLTGGNTTPALANTSSSATIIVNNSVLTASSTNNAISSTSGGSLRLSCSFVHAVNGRVPVNAPVWRLETPPTNAFTRYALNGIGTYTDMFTADNSTALNQAAPTDVRAGVAYGISNSQTGRLTVPARGSVALSVNYGPSMPFTATRSGTTATATLTYSYPLVVGDTITVTGASNTEWNSTYTIASVVSGTSVTFVVPNTHSATAGTGATMQTTGTAVLDPAAVASAVWGAASRTITGGTVTTLTNAPASVTPSDIWSHAARTLTSASGPSATDIRQELDTNSTKLANLDTTVSSRLASSVSTNITAIKAKTDLLNTDRLGQVATTSIVGNLIAQSNS